MFNVGSLRVRQTITLHHTDGKVSVPKKMTTLNSRIPYEILVNPFEEHDLLHNTRQTCMSQKEIILNFFNSL